MDDHTDGDGIYSMGANSGILALEEAAFELKFVTMYVREKTPIQWQSCKSNALNIAQWYHFCQVITATGMNFYVDTVDQGAINPGGYGGDINYPDAIEFLIGQYAGNVSDSRIDEFAYWNTELSTTEIALLAQSRVKRLPLQIKPANLLLYLPFDDVNIGQSFTTAVDLSGNSNDATGVDTPLFQPGVLSYPQLMRY